MRVRGVDLAAPGTPWLDPIVDITPGEVVDAFVTEAGILRRPFGPELIELAAAVAARSPEPGPAGRDALSGPARPSDGTPADPLLGTPDVSDPPGAPGASG
jgi:hypothetical protein